jgi:putative ABC transport system permease protein
MIDLQFRDSEGNLPDKAHEELLQRQALDGLKLPRRIIITNEMRLLKGYRIGQTMPLDTVHGPENFTICGIIWSPVIDALVQLFDLGSQFDQRTASYVFGTLDEARNDFGVERIHYFAANVDMGIAKEDLLAGLSPQIKAMAATRPNFGLGGELMASLGNSLGKLGLGIADVRHIKSNMQTTFGRLLLILSSIALAAMAVASLGVANTLWASIRTRRWELGILRSIGLTRAQLIRLILAEALLLGLVGIALGAACGAEMTFDARGLSQFLLGYDVPLAIPWPIISIGAATLVAIALAASLWPALSASRQSPLSLLQGGRAAA